MGKENVLDIRLLYYFSKIKLMKIKMILVYVIFYLIDI